MADKKKEPRGLGIGALLSSISQNNAIADIPLAQIQVNPFQPRSEFNADALEELAESIRQHGLIQPITVRAMGGGDSYQLISGERRLRASKLAGLLAVPAFVRTANDEEMLEMALIENIQREELNAIEIAITYKRLMEEFKLHQDEVAHRVGKKRETVTNYLRLLKLPEAIQIGVQQAKISMGHARALVSIADFAIQMTIFKEIIEKDLSVRQVEQLAQLYKQNSSKDKEEKPKKALPLAHQDVQKRLTTLFDTRVQLRRNEDGKGQMVIHFSDDMDLNRILDILQQE